MAESRARLSEELLRRLTAALRAGQLYSKGHPIITRNVEGFARAIDAFHELTPTLIVGIVEDQVIVDEMPVPRGAGFESLIRRLKQIGIERVTIEKGVTSESPSSITCGSVAGGIPREPSGRS